MTIIGYIAAGLIMLALLFMVAKYLDLKPRNRNRNQ